MTTCSPPFPDSRHPLSHLPHLYSLLNQVFFRFTSYPRCMQSTSLGEWLHCVSTACKHWGGAGMGRWLACEALKGRQIWQPFATKMRWPQELGTLLSWTINNKSRWPDECMIILVASLDLLKEPANAACSLSGCVHRKRLCTSPHVIPLSSHVTWAMSRAVSCLANSGRHAIALVCQGLWARPRRQRAPLSPAPGDTAAAGASDTAAKRDARQNLWIWVLFHLPIHVPSPEKLSTAVQVEATCWFLLILMYLWGEAIAMASPRTCFPASAIVWSNGAWKSMEDRVNSNDEWWAMMESRNNLRWAPNLVISCWCFLNFAPTNGAPHPFMLTWLLWMLAV